MMDIAPRLEIVDLKVRRKVASVQKCYFVKKNPETGGVTNPPKPHPMKKMEESLPVMFLFLATQEKADPNCAEKSHHRHNLIIIIITITITMTLTCQEMKKPRAAVPR